MFRIRRIYDSSLPSSIDAIEQVKKILHDQFPGVDEKDIAKINDQLVNPLKHRFRSILFVADDSSRRVKGFALLMHAADLDFCYLDFISAARFVTGRGIGSALYDKVREEALALGAVGIFFECLPDDPALCRDGQVLKQNASRLRFYERYGVRPVCNTAYETPVREGGDCPPYLMFDGLGLGRPLSRAKAREIVRAILERKYGNVCPESYIDMVVDSFRDDPVRFRECRYARGDPRSSIKVNGAGGMPIALVVNDKHDIHHVNDRGYVEAPVRIKSILQEILPSGLFETFEPRTYSERHIRAVHDGAFVDYLRRVCENVPENRSVYPYVFPIRNAARPPVELPVRAGYYCIDTFTPLYHNAFLAAKRAVDCTLAAADKILQGYPIAYSLVRPPGHHAERRAFGGFCYFNSAAVAAHYLSAYGKVAVLDVDYHHGNGQQNIFYKRNDVLTVSIHGHPRFAYPYFSGFPDETGLCAGAGFNVNYPLPEQADGYFYREVLGKALRKIRKFGPRFLVVALGLDTAKGDPTGTWSLGAGDFERNGALIGSLKCPTLVVQEGGYRARSLGVNARNFFQGMWAEYHSRNMQEKKETGIEIGRH
ncbi:MAG: histone deacetylase family protein [Acidobacteria bacterium]|nr:histone deacetylase family protein [Acidobacteriota bacterium]